MKLIRICNQNNVNEKYYKIINFIINKNDEIDNNKRKSIINFTNNQGYSLLSYSINMEIPDQECYKYSFNTNIIKSLIENGININEEAKNHALKIKKILIFGRNRIIYNENILKKLENNLLKLEKIIELLNKKND